MANPSLNPWPNEIQSFLIKLRWIEAALQITPVDSSGLAVESCQDPPESLDIYEQIHLMIDSFDDDNKISQNFRQLNNNQVIPI